MLSLKPPNRPRLQRPGILNLSHVKKQLLPALVALGLLAGCATSRRVNREEESGESRAERAAASQSYTADTTTTSTRTAATFTATTSTADRAQREEVETTTTEHQYDATGRVVKTTTTRRTTGQSSRQGQATSTATSSATRTDTTARTTAAAATSTSTEKLTDKRTRKQVRTAGRPWYYWPLRGAILLCIAAAIYFLWPFLAPVFGWLFLFFTRRKKQNGA